MRIDPGCTRKNALHRKRQYTRGSSRQQLRHFYEHAEGQIRPEGNPLMAIYHREFAQLSEEWFAMRRGIPTASSFDKIITAGGKEEKCKRSTQDTAYMNRLLAEWVLGEDLETNPYESDRASCRERVE